MACTGCGQVPMAVSRKHGNDRPNKGGGLRVGEQVLAS